MTDQDIQRATLRDLVSLATECTATENEIERAYRIEVEKENGRHDRMTREIARKYGAQREQAKATREQAVARAESTYAQALAKLKADDQELRRKVASKHAQMLQEVTKKQDQAVWLSDSVLENEQNGAAEDFKQARIAAEAHLQALEVMERDAGKLYYDYGVEVPKGDPAELEKEAAVQVKPEDAAATYIAQRAIAERQLALVAHLPLMKLVIGITPWLIMFVLMALAAGGAFFATGMSAPNWVAIGSAGGGAVVLWLVLWLVLKSIAKGKARAAYVPFRQAITLARKASEAEVVHATAERERRLYEAHKKRKEEVQAVTDKYAPYMTQAARKRDAAMETVQAEYAKQHTDIKVTRDRAVSAADEAERKALAEAAQREEVEQKKAVELHEQRVAMNKQRYQEALSSLTTRLNDGLAKLRVPSKGSNGLSAIPWEDPSWQKFVPPKTFPDQVRFADLIVDLRKISDASQVAPKPKSRLGQLNDRETDGDGDGNGDGQNAAAVVAPDRHLQLPPPFPVPVSLMYPKLGSLLIQADREARSEALRAMQMVMARLLSSLPAGRVRFTVIDPIGRGENFAGFMRLADYEKDLVGGRIWTEQDQIDQRLADMTEHMETVIQKYLRNEYETIDAYNAQAGELAEPYRVLVVADFPTAFEGESAKRLASICTSGARCGVYTLVMRDLRQSLPQGSFLDEVERNSVNVVWENGKFILKDDIFSLFPLKLDPPPSEATLIKVLDVVGAGAKAAKRVELSFDLIAPSVEKTWSASTASELVVPVGRSGATKVQELRLGKGVAQHVLIAGKTGSGKSTLLHAMVTNLALWYSPDEVEFYLVDFKKGVEFKTYATHSLPHARAIAVESDREFGLSVLQRLDAELTRRGNLFRNAGTQDVAAYRATPGALRMPRTLLMIDEFQEFFSEDDRVAQEASLLIDRLVRQGRAFGMHVLLGSQTIGGSSGLPRSTIGQMAVRIALMTSEADSQLILGDNNSAARLLSRPGEAIYNDGGGLVENNSPFQVAWLPDPKREEYLDRVHQLAIKRKIDGRDPLIVFEGNAPADVTKNSRLIELLESPTYPVAPPVTYGYLGDPVAIKDPSASAYRRQAGSNILIVGQQDEAAMALMCVTILSLAAQEAPGKAIFYIFDGTPADSSLVGTFERVKAAIPHEVKLVEYRLVAEALNEVAAEVARRQSSGDTDTPSIYCFYYGLQRYRMLRKTEETFSFGAADTEKPPEPDKQFVTILKEGPSFGVHTILWSDTPATMERTLDRGALREFDNRILFQMSQNDSSNLIDSPAGNKLGQNRALIYSEEQGMLEKFRPYAIPSQEFLNYVKGKLAAKKA